MKLMAAEVWAPRIVDSKKKEYYFAGGYAGVISNSKSDASFAYDEDGAKYIGKLMMPLIQICVEGKLVNSPLKRKN